MFGNQGAHGGASVGSLPGVGGVGGVGGDGRNPGTNGAGVGGTGMSNRAVASSATNGVWLIHAVIGVGMTSSSKCGTLGGGQSVRHSQTTFRGQSQYDTSELYINPAAHVDSSGRSFLQTK